MGGWNASERQKTVSFLDSSSFLQPSTLFIVIMTKSSRPWEFLSGPKPASHPISQCGSVLICPKPDGQNSMKIIQPVRASPTVLFTSSKPLLQQVQSWPKSRKPPKVSGRPRNWNRLDWCRSCCHPFRLEVFRWVWSFWFRLRLRCRPDCCSKTRHFHSLRRNQGRSSCHCYRIHMRCIVDTNMLPGGSRLSLLAATCSRRCGSCTGASKDRHRLHRAITQVTALKLLHQWHMARCHEANLSQLYMLMLSLHHNIYHHRMMVPLMTRSCEIGQTFDSHMQNRRSLPRCACIPGTSTSWRWACRRPTRWARWARRCWTAATTSSSTSSTTARTSPATSPLLPLTSQRLIESFSQWRIYCLFCIRFLAGDTMIWGLYW